MQYSRKYNIQTFILGADNTKEKYELPKEVFTCSRMHLNQKQSEKITDILEGFITSCETYKVNRIVKDDNGEAYRIKTIYQDNINALFIGVDNFQPIVMASDANALCIETNKSFGWIPFPMPKDVKMFTGMVLNKELAISIKEDLDYYIETNDLEM